jgi:subtilisin family serine protease
MKKRSHRVLVGLLATGVVAAFGVVTHVALAGETADEDPVRLVVGYQPGTEIDPSARRVTTSGLRLDAGDPLPALSARTISVPGDDVAEVSARLRKDSTVAFVEVDGIRRTFGVTADDPLFSKQLAVSQIGLPAAWESTTGSPGVTVAVVDDGVAPIGDLSGAVLSGWDFLNEDNDASDDAAHGTMVASLIAGRGNNGAGIAGSCWKCRIMPVKVMDRWGSAHDSTIAEGITYAADKGAKIIVLAFGAPGRSNILQLATDYARGKGALVIASVGTDVRADKNYPAANEGVLAVGGTDEDGNRYSKLDPVLEREVGSHQGADWVDLAAPYCTHALQLTGFRNDVDVTDTGDDDYVPFCGTSVSAALVAGAASLVKSHNPNANLWALERSLTSTALPLTGGWVRDGQVRADRAVVAVDRTAPKITGATPGYLARFRGSVTVTATGVSDAGGAGVSHVWLYADGKYVGSDYSAPFAVKYHSGTRNATIKLQWKVFDRAGNTGTLNRNVIADNAPPSLRLTSAPKHNAKVKGTITLKATATDPGGVSRVELLINNKVVTKD